MNEFLANTHPFVVHFAVSLVIMSALFDVLHFIFRKEHLSTTGFSLSIAAVPFLLIAVLTGNLAETYLEPALVSESVESHKLFANITVWAFTAIVFWRVFMTVKKKFSGWIRLLYVALIIIIASITFLTAKHGGDIRHNVPVHQYLSFSFINNYKHPYNL